MPNYQRGMISALGRFSTELMDQLGRTRGSSQTDRDLEQARLNLQLAYAKAIEEDTAKESVLLWSVDAVCAWAGDQIFSAYRQLFRDSLVTGRVLLELSDDDRDPGDPCGTGAWTPTWDKGENTCADWATAGASLALRTRASRLEDAAGRYIEAAKQSFPRGSTLEGLRIVVDCAHGADDG